MVIPCYNHAHFLPKAIESVLRQTHANTEIVVVDDGSTDDTKAVASRYPQVRYVWQQNQGLSAARNTGIKHSTGDYLLFLDADDWLYPKGIETNVKHLQQNKELAFVSGFYNYVYINENEVVGGGNVVNADYYCRLLQGNYICMIATVLFRKQVFQEFLFDTSLRSCEDYDLYLKVTRKYPVYHHTEKIAAYRIHSYNMSTNIPGMLKSALEVLSRHKQNLATETEKKAYPLGFKSWTDYYCKKIYKKLRRRQMPTTRQDLYMLLRYRPQLYAKYLIAQLLSL